MRVKGSYTVEASLLMGILLPVLVGLIYLGFYLHNQANMQGAVCELTAYAALQKENREMEELVEKKRTELLNGYFPGLSETALTVSVHKEKVTAEMKGTFRIPGWIGSYFSGIRHRLHVQSELEIPDAAKTVYQIRKIKELAEEGEG